MHDDWLGARLAAINARGDMRAIRLLELDELQAIDTALQTVGRVWTTNDLVNVVRSNFRVLTGFMMDTLDMYSQGRLPIGDPDISVRSDIQRHVLNVLTSFRVYLDHTDSRLKRLYGPTSSQWLAYKSLCSREFDAHFSYRFIYKLRDYAVHCGLPVGSSVLGSEEGDADPPKDSSMSVRREPLGVYFMTLAVKRDDLLREFQWKRLRADIEAQPESIELSSHLGFMHSRIVAIHAECQRLEHSTILPHALRLQAVADEVWGQCPGSSPMIMRDNGTGPDAAQIRIQLAPIPVAVVGRIIAGCGAAGRP